MATKTVCDHCGDEITEKPGVNFVYSANYVKEYQTAVQVLDLCPRCKRRVLDAIEHPVIVKAERA